MSNDGFVSAFVDDKPNEATNGYHQASASVRVVFRDNNVHPWQQGVVTEEYFDPE